MKAELKADWVEALRSGRYRQGHQYLLRDDKYCCLGVLGRICGVTRDELHGAFWRPIEALEVIDEKQMHVLANMNDNEKRSFPEIADYIEQNL